MFKEEDYQNLFGQFTQAGQGSNIQTIYNIMPALTQEQTQIIADALFFADKWEIPQIREYILQLVEIKKKNRSLGFMPSFKNFLKYYTLAEQFKGYKIQGSTGDEK